ncbi:hypothetical protein TNCV_2227851 [Trichonephila clavipes]|nr:hypothetical protein TNCV_2227851 [Trichonephila clavipes]
MKVILLAEPGVEGHLKPLVYETPIVTVVDLSVRIVVSSADISSTLNLFERIRQSFVPFGVGCAMTSLSQLRTIPVTITYRCISEVEL